jgi:hypothetical protein
MAGKAHGYCGKAYSSRVGKAKRAHAVFRKLWLRIRRGHAAPFIKRRTCFAGPAFRFRNDLEMQLQQRRIKPRHNAWHDLFEVLGKCGKMIRANTVARPHRLEADHGALT